MANYNFGKSELRNKTPQGVSAVIDITTAVCGGLVTWLQSTDLVPVKPSSIISSLLGLIIIVAQAIKPFFGEKIKPIP